MAIYKWREEVSDPRRGPCDAGFHVPSSGELKIINTILTTTFGLTATSTTMADYLKMPKAGWRLASTGAVSDQGSIGMYWSSTPLTTSNYRCGMATDFGDNYLTVEEVSRANACCVRGFKDNAEAPDSNWTILYSAATVATNAGIFWNSTKGLISISGDGVNWYTIQDKNVGATAVYNNGDTLSESNCGKYYQRGNNYGFLWTDSITTTLNQVDASGYGPDNYYNDSTFIRVTSAPEDWSSVDNPNLWGGAEGDWTSGINTVAYRPLKGDYKDYSGNGYNLTANGGVSLATLDGIVCAKGGTSATSYLQSNDVPLPSGGAQRTVSFWYNEVSTSGTHHIFNYGEDATYKRFGMQTGGSTFRMPVGGAEYVMTGFTLTVGNWYHVVLTYDGTQSLPECGCKINGTASAGDNLILNTTAVSSDHPLRLFGAKGSTYYSRGYLSEVIVEDRVWTSAEILAYYNKTKGNYGIV